MTLKKHDLWEAYQAIIELKSITDELDRGSDEIYPTAMHKQILDHICGLSIYVSTNMKYKPISKSVIFDDILEHIGGFVSRMKDVLLED